MYMSSYHWAIPFSSRTCALPLLLFAFLFSITLVPIDTSALHLSLDLARIDAINPISAHSVAASRLGHIDHFHHLAESASVTDFLHLHLCQNSCRLW